MHRITTIIGAGAILDFDFGNRPKPTSQRMLDVMLGKHQCIGDSNCQFINNIYTQIIEAARLTYEKSSITIFPDSFYEPHITFEDLFDTLETMMSYAVAWTDDRQKLKPYVAGLIRPIKMHQYGNYYSALRYALLVIMNEVKNYDQPFRKNNDSEIWYRQFWREFKGRTDIFNLNYDTTIEKSLGADFEDGFVPYDNTLMRFVPSALMENKRNVSTVNHLHGCILYTDIPPLHSHIKNYTKHDLFKYITYPVLDNINYFNIPYSQSGGALVYSPIIMGLHKTDKICYIPQNYYHANLTNCILRNSSILIVGYSFGDIYLNQLLQQHQLIHMDKQRMIIIDYWSEVDKSGVVYYHYKHTSNIYFQHFIESIIHINGFQLQKYLESLKPIHEHCYDITPNLRIYTSGFKESVQKYQSEIFEYLAM